MRQEECLVQVHRRGGLHALEVDALVNRDRRAAGTPSATSIGRMASDARRSSRPAGISSERTSAFR